MRLWIPGKAGVTKPTRQQALSELAKASREIHKRYALGEMTLAEAERQLQELNGKYETVLDRLLAV